MENTIQVSVLDREGELHSLDAPTDMAMNIMELCKAYELPVEGTCGGMALCATCHVKVNEATPSLSGPSDDELDMLETLPFIFQESRLACQIKLNEHIEQLTITIINN